MLSEMGLGPVWEERSDEVVKTTRVEPVSEKRAPQIPTQTAQKSAPSRVIPVRKVGPVQVDASIAEKAAKASWEELQVLVKHCEQCPELVSNRTLTVLGHKAPETKLLLIGEAPGREEDLQGEPFVGASGKLLDNMLSAVHLSRDKDVSIINVLKCRPPNNRDPSETEASACRVFLMRQIELLAPQKIILLGKPALRAVLGFEGAVTAARLKKHDFTIGNLTIPTFVTYHPSYLLRSPQEKAKAWQDFLYALNF